MRLAIFPQLNSTGLLDNYQPTALEQT